MMSIAFPDQSDTCMCNTMHVPLYSNNYLKCLFTKLYIVFSIKHIFLYSPFIGYDGCSFDISSLSFIHDLCGWVLTIENTEFCIKIAFNIITIIIIQQAIYLTYTCASKSNLAYMIYQYNCNINYTEKRMCVWQGKIQVRVTRNNTGNG